MTRRHNWGGVQGVQTLSSYPGATQGFLTAEMRWGPAVPDWEAEHPFSAPRLCQWLPNKPRQVTSSLYGGILSLILICFMYINKTANLLRESFSTSSGKRDLIVIRIASSFNKILGLGFFVCLFFTDFMLHIHENMDSEDTYNPSLNSISHRESCCSCTSSVHHNTSEPLLNKDRGLH